MNRKGQVTLFIILAIVIVALVAGFFIFKDKLGFGNSNADSNEVQVFVQDCLDKVSEEVILEVGQGGGYFGVPDFSTLNGVTYYYFEGKNHFPSLDFVEKGISNSISNKLVECVNNFSDFDYEINFENPFIKTEVLEEKIYVSVRFPIQVIKDENRILLKDFESVLNFRMGLIYDVVSKIIEEEPLAQGICLSCNLDYALNNDLQISYLDSDLTTTIFTIKDSESKFEFVFANDYSEENGI